MRVGDTDPEVRQEAHRGLVGLAQGQVDFGPSANAGDADGAALAGKGSLACRTASQGAGRRALGRLRLAIVLRDRFKELRRLNDPESREIVKKRFQEIVTEFPATQAASEAQRELTSLE